MISSLFSYILRLAAAIYILLTIQHIKFEVSLVTFISSMLYIRDIVLHCFIFFPLLLLILAIASTLQPSNSLHSSTLVMIFTFCSRDVVSKIP
uniref:Uncharacterized protein n=1 Tax=Octopus bimaculoides TaxID=37653 RepID=A0A0L8GV26_OCTBM